MQKISLMTLALSAMVAFVQSAPVRTASQHSSSRTPAGHHGRSGNNASSSANTAPIGPSPAPDNGNSTPSVTDPHQNTGGNALPVTDANANSTEHSAIEQKAQDVANEAIEKGKQTADSWIDKMRNAAKNFAENASNKIKVIEKKTQDAIGGALKQYADTHDNQFSHAFKDHEGDLKKWADHTRESFDKAVIDPAAQYAKEQVDRINDAVHDKIHDAADAAKKNANALMEQAKQAIQAKKAEVIANLKKQYPNLPIEAIQKMLEAPAAPAA